jgi:hypothetical protein
VGGNGIFAQSFCVLREFVHGQFFYQRDDVVGVWFSLSQGLDNRFKRTRETREGGPFTLARFFLRRLSSRRAFSVRAFIDWRLVLILLMLSWEFRLMALLS